MFTVNYDFGDGLTFKQALLDYGDEHILDYLDYVEAYSKDSTYRHLELHKPLQDYSLETINGMLKSSDLETRQFAFELIKQSLQK